MIRDWGLWELTDEDWHGFVPVRESRKQQENGDTIASGTEESLAPSTEEKASDRPALLQEEGELESAISPSIEPPIEPEIRTDSLPTTNIEENIKERIDKENKIEENPPPESDRPTASPVRVTPVQKEENLEPIRVTSPKVSRSPKISQFIPPPTPPTPVKASRETEPETVKTQPLEAEKKEISPDFVPASPAKPEMSKSPQTDSPQKSASIALKIGDVHISTEEVVPLLEKYQLLPKLVREIIIDRALVSIECPSEELTQAIEGFYKQQKVNSPQQLQAWLRQKQSSIEQVQSAIARSIKLEKFKEKTWGDRLEAYFLERKLEFDKVLYSLLRTQDLGVAQELYFRILEEESEFAPLAKEYSQGVESKTGGIIGPISLSKIHPTLKEMFQRSKPGQLWSPQYIDNWFVVVRLEQFVPAKLDEEVRQKLLDECFSQWLQEQYQQVAFQ
ncbi:MAG: peptidylprolyl isomerase [Cyanobacteria bacterium P01_E01_bin.42]